FGRFCPTSCVSWLLFSAYQAIAPTSSYRSVVVPARAAYSHWASVGRATHFPSLLLIQPLDKRLYILPRDVFYRSMQVTNEVTRVRTHHRCPLGLRHFILAQIKRLADDNTVGGLFVRERCCIRVWGAHHEGPRRNQHKLHAEPIGQRWRGLGTLRRVRTPRLQ